MDADQYCFDLVRAGDKDRFLASLFAPEEKRKYLLALYAFNIEVSRIPELVSDASVGEIRYQWWLDTIDAIYHGEDQQHPVAQGLTLAIAEGALPKHALQNLVKAKIFDLYADPMPSMTDLEGYIGETSSALIQMASLILGREEALNSAEAAGLAGVAYGLSGILRSLPRHRAMARCYVPLDLLVQHGASVADLIAGENLASIATVLAKLRENIRQRLAEARSLAPTIKPTIMPALLHVSLTESYLLKLNRAGVNVLKSGAEIAQWRKQLILWKAARLERF
jgi:15-cis-phytoene synthase